MTSKALCDSFEREKDGFNASLRLVEVNGKFGDVILVMLARDGKKTRLQQALTRQKSNFSVVEWLKVLFP